MLCDKFCKGLQESSHKLNYLLPEKRIIQYDMRQLNKYPLPKTMANI